MAYPALRTTKEDDNVDFSFLRRQLFTSYQAEALECEIFLLHSVHSAQNVYLRHESLSRIKRNKETLNVLLLLEKTNSQRLTHIQALSDDYKVDFLTIKVVLRNPYNAHDNSLPKRNCQLTTSELRVNVWLTDLGLISNFPFSGGGATRAGEVKFQTAISRKRLR